MFHHLIVPVLAIYEITAASTPNELAPRQVQVHPELDAQAYPENFNPALASKYGNISCVGDTYALELPLQDGWNPNEVSVQHICAKPQYGGGPRGQHIGGWCSHGKVAFDISDAADVNTQLSNPRVELGCRYRCFCNRLIPENRRSIQPKSGELQAFAQTSMRTSSQTYQISLDIVNDFTMPRDAKSGSLGDAEVKSVQIQYVKELSPALNLQYQLDYQYISEDSGNKIICDGPLPTFMLPVPYNETGDFQNLQQLCAIQLDGGLLGANAGGYCYRSDAITNGGQTVWFSDEMTPRLDWTWGGGSFFASASIRFHCKQYCRCAADRTNNTYLESMWEFVAGTQLVQRPQGQLDMEPAGSTGPLPTGSMMVLPAQGGNGGLSGTCGDDRQQFCPRPWPIKFLGPIPSAPPDASNVVTPLAPRPDPAWNSNLTACGKTCNGPQDCGSGNDIHACACALPNPTEAKALGLDPVAPLAACLVLLHTIFGGKGNLIGREETSGRGGLEGRAAELHLDGEGTPRRCLCNSTFVHNSCCGSQDGMVWLH